MEERKFDPYQFIGFVLIAIIFTWMLYVNKPEEGEIPLVEQDKKEIDNQQNEEYLSLIHI